MQHSGFYSHRYDSAYKNLGNDRRHRRNSYLSQNWIQYDERSVYRRRPARQRKSKVSVDGVLLCTFMESMDRHFKPYGRNILYILATYDMILAGHALVISMKLFAEHFPDEHFHPKVFVQAAAKDCLQIYLRGFY